MIIRIENLEHQGEALALGAALDEKGIKHVLRSYHDLAYDGLFQASAGWGHIEAEESDAAAIREILKSIRCGDHALPEQDEDDAEVGRVEQSVDEHCQVEVPRLRLLALAVVIGLLPLYMLMTGADGKPLVVETLNWLVYSREPVHFILLLGPALACVPACIITVQAARSSAITERSTASNPLAALLAAGMVVWLMTITYSFIIRPIHGPTSQVVFMHLSYYIISVPSLLALCLARLRPGRSVVAAITAPALALSLAGPLSVYGQDTGRPGWIATSVVAFFAIILAFFCLAPYWRQRCLEVAFRESLSRREDDGQVQ